MLPQPLRRAVLRVLPRPVHIPLRYYYRRAFRIDPELRLLRGLAAPGTRAIDIGANLGVYTYALWRLGCEVEAFEPVPALALGLRAFRRPRIRVHETALSSSAGQKRLHFTAVDGEVDLGRGTLSPTGQGADYVDVSVQRLDDFGFHDISFIKIDAEGHELDILAGAIQTIESNRPNLLVEIEQRHLATSIDTVFNALKDLAYGGQFLQRGIAHLIHEFSWDVHQRDTLGMPDYVNNFVFRPRV